MNSKERMMNTLRRTSPANVQAFIDAVQTYGVYE